MSDRRPVIYNGTESRGYVLSDWLTSAISYAVLTPLATFGMIKAYDIFNSWWSAPNSQGNPHQANGTVNDPVHHAAVNPVGVPPQPFWKRHGKILLNKLFSRDALYVANEFVIGPEIDHKFRGAASPVAFFRPIMGEFSKFLQSHNPFSLGGPRDWLESAQNIVYPENHPSQDTKLSAIRRGFGHFFDGISWIHENTGRRFLNWALDIDAKQYESEYAYEWGKTFSNGITGVASIISPINSCKKAVINAASDVAQSANENPYMATAITTGAAAGAYWMYSKATQAPAARPQQPQRNAVMQFFAGPAQP
jgi:hypothetical protein